MRDRVMRKREQPIRLLGGGHEFQEERGHNLPENLWIGPSPGTQGRGTAGQIVPSPGSAAGLSDELAMPAASRRARSRGGDLSEPWRTLMYGTQRKGDLLQTYGIVGTNPVLIRPAENRIYLIVQNTSLANTLLVGVGYGPQIVAGGATGFILLPNGGNYEPSVIPQQDIWVTGSAAGTTWVMAAAVG